MEVIIKPSNRRLTVQSGSNLLETLLSNQVAISHSCKSGRCGTCRCRILSGTVRGPNAPDGRIASSHQVLACMSTLISDCEIEITEPDEIVVHPARTLRAEITAFDTLTHDVRRLRLRTNKPLEYSPGQYAQLQFGPNAIRPYSMAGVYGDDELEFHIRVIPDGRVTSQLDTMLTVGDKIKISGPMGTSYLRTKHQGPILCVAGGTGLAPMLSVVRGALESGMPCPINLFFGVRSGQDIYFKNELEEFSRTYPNFQYYIVVTNNESSDEYHSGFVTDAIPKILDNLEGWHVYLAGPPPMVEAGVQLSPRLGTNPDHIFADAFYSTGV